MKNNILFLSVLFFLSCLNNTKAQSQSNEGVELFNNIKMSGNWFISYRDGVRQVQADEVIPAFSDRQSQIILKRSYFTLKKDLNKMFSVRYTMDLTVDKEGNDAGNVETRLKYLYAKAKPQINVDYLTGTFIEVGMVHTPWLDYEQKINTYRVQDNMFIERNKIFNSADFGLTVAGNVGPEMNKEFLKEVNGSMKGKYLSYMFGIYNGGGYSGAENNTNKVVSGRISTRPLAETLPELQVSVFGTTGKGNTELMPDFNQILGMIAYTGSMVTANVQGHTGKGDFRARYVDANDPSRALENDGYSVFGEVKFYEKDVPLAVWARFDEFALETRDSDLNRIIGGVTYRVNKNLRLVADIEHDTALGEKSDIYELNIHVSF